MKNRKLNFTLEKMNNQSRMFYEGYQIVFRRVQNQEILEQLKEGDILNWKRLESEYAYRICNSLLN